MTRRLFAEDSYAQTCTAIITAVHPQGIELDQTIFYPMGGGQPGDQGTLTTADGRCWNVIDTVKGEDDRVLHRVEQGTEDLHPGTSVTAQIDWDRRHLLMRYHTCLHLLCSVVAAPVTGGRMSTDKAHLDFAIEAAALQAQDIEVRLNALVAQNLPLQVGSITDAELDANPELIKTLSVHPPRGQGRVRTIEIPGVDRQPCGGTHLARTGEIGTVRVTRIRSEGKRNKRVTIALTSES